MTTLAYSWTASEPRAGARIGAYELQHPVAEGGMGTIWLGLEHRPLARPRRVAIKLLRSGLKDDRIWRAQLAQEGRLAMRIAHPNVVRTLDAGDDALGAYVVMEWLDGATLAALRARDVPRGCRADHGALVRVMADVCAGLHASHEARDAAGRAIGIVHCDVSPANIVITSSGAVKVIDFGVAYVPRANAADGTRRPFGTLRYMAPEQARGESVDRRADVWSVGAILHLLLTGRSPYEGNKGAILQSLRRGAPPLMATAPVLVEGVPTSLVAIMRRALARDREDRYVTALELKEALENAARALRLDATESAVAAFVAAGGPSAGALPPCALASGSRPRSASLAAGATTRTAFEIAGNA